MWQLKMSPKQHACARNPHGCLLKPQGGAKLPPITRNPAGHAVLKAYMSLYACQPSGPYRVNHRDSGCKNGLLITEIWDILEKLLESVSLGGDGESDAWRPFNFFGGPLFL
jgi:hypothetical protein